MDDLYTQYLKIQLGKIAEIKSEIEKNEEKREEVIKEIGRLAEKIIWLKSMIEKKNEPQTIEDVLERIKMQEKYGM